MNDQVNIVDRTSVGAVPGSHAPEVSNRADQKESAAAPRAEKRRAADCCRRVVMSEASGERSRGNRLQKGTNALII